MTLTSPTRGAAAEQYVIAQALRRGFRVAVPGVDLDGVDLYIFSSRGELATVQVKTAKRHRRTWRLRLDNNARRRYTVDAFVAVAPGFEKAVHRAGRGARRPAAQRRAARQVARPLGRPRGGGSLPWEAA